MVKFFYAEIIKINVSSVTVGKVDQLFILLQCIIQMCLYCLQEKLEDTHVTKGDQK